MRALVTVPGPYRRLLAGVGLYGLGNFSTTLLILWATDVLHDQGRSSASAAAVARAPPRRPQRRQRPGRLSGRRGADRVGRRNVLAAGVAPFAAACAAFALGSTRVALMAILFGAVGTSTALAETGAGAHSAEVLHPSVRGRGYGLLGLIHGIGDQVSIGDLVSSVTVGVLFTVASPAAGFVYAAGTGPSAPPSW